MISLSPLVDDDYQRTQTHLAREIESDSCILPWFVKYVAWLVCILIIVGSAAFLLTFGIMYGNDRIYQWLSSMIITFFTGIMIFDPLLAARTEQVEDQHG